MLFFLIFFFFFYYRSRICLVATETQTSKTFWVRVRIWYEHSESWQTYCTNSPGLQISADFIRQVWSQIHLWSINHQ